jgi:hypothetical protein
MFLCRTPTACGAFACQADGTADRSSRCRAAAKRGLTMLDKAATALFAFMLALAMGFEMLFPV